MEHIFCDGPNKFTNMTDDIGAYCEAITQNTYINVDEEGTEASGVTKVTMATRCMPQQFVVNRPFSFYIVDNEGLVFFYGVVNVPN